MKKNIVAFLILFVISAIILVFGDRIYDAINAKYFVNDQNDQYLFGSKTGEHGKIGIKIRVDDLGSIKEVIVLEHPDNEIANAALQKLINMSLDKQSVDEIDAISGATETSNIYKGIIAKLIQNNPEINEESVSNKVSLTDSDIAKSIEREVYNPDGLKSGVGGYVMNNLQDADYSKNGDLVTNEYICAVVVNKRNSIIDVKFDHIISNISFDRNGSVPTGDAKAYAFLSDKGKTGFDGIINDGSFINIFDFEKSVLELRHFEDVKSRYINKSGYVPLISALENAIDNARFVGASDGDMLGLSAYKILKKADIKNATDDENGKVNFTSIYALITVDKNMNISSTMFDNVTNNIILTSDGEILGSREKEVYTLNELTNAQKYSKIDENKFIMKVQYNDFADMIRNLDINSILNLISKSIDNKGFALKDGALSKLDSIDFVDFIDAITNSYADAVRIRK